MRSRETRRIHDSAVRRGVAQEALRRGRVQIALEAYSGEARQLPEDPAEFEEFYNLLIETLRDPSVHARDKLAALDIADRFLVSERLSPQRAEFLVQRHDDVATMFRESALAELRIEHRLLGIIGDITAPDRQRFMDVIEYWLPPLIGRYGAEHPMVTRLLTDIAMEARKFPARAHPRDHSQERVVRTVYRELSREQYAPDNLAPRLRSSTHGEGRGPRVVRSLPSRAARDVWRRVVREADLRGGHEWDRMVEQVANEGQSSP